MTLVQIAHYTSPNYTDHPKWIYTEYTVLKIFSLFRIFEQRALALKNRVFPQNFHCIEYISYQSRFFSNSALALKNRVCPEFTVLNINFLSFRILNNLRLPWIRCIEYIYIYIYIFLQWRAVRFVTREALSLSKPNLRVYELNGVA